MNRFFSQIFSSFGIVIRTFRAFFTRQIAGIRARFRRLTSFSRQAAKAIPKVAQSAAMATKKPSKREDYIETSRMFISKSMLLLLLLALIALGILIYFFVWPWLLSQFFTAHKFYQAEDVSSYTGKVVLYYDAEKTRPMLRGKLTGGVLGGEGEEFDESGLIIYSGGFEGGEYEGAGQLYEEGALIYEGGFSQGLYSGEGTLYEDGQPVYKGGFAEGLFEGPGSRFSDGVLIYKGDFVSGLYDGTNASQYARSGALIYRGGFSEGKRSGMGDEYYETGQIKYRGYFMNDLYDQQGSAYNEDGTPLYKGGYLLGAYEGQGTLCLGDGVSVEAAFEKGVPVGRAAIYRSGSLYYEGEVDNLVPDGVGTLCASDGTSVYTGRISQGKLNGAHLIGVPTEEVRAMFGDAALKETRGPRSGFAVHNAALGITLFSTFKTSASEPRVFNVYLYDKDADEFFDLLPWETAAEYESWCAESGQEEPTKVEAKLETPTFPNGLPFEKREYFKVAYTYADYGLVLWSLKEGGKLFMVEWHDVGYLPAASSGGSKTASGARMETLLGQLELAPPVSDPGEAGGKYYAAADPSVELSRTALDEDGNAAVDEEGNELKEPLSFKEVETVVSCMLDFLEQAEIRAALEDQLTLKQRLLALEREALAMDRGSQEAVDAMESEVEAAQLAINKCIVGMNKAQLAMSEAGGGALADYDLKKALFVADPTLINTAEANAAVTSGEGMEMDPTLKLALMELELSYEGLLQAIGNYDKLKQRGAELERDYAVDDATDADIYRAACDASDAAIELYSQLCAHSKKMLALNTMTNGWLAASLSWGLTA